MLLQIDSCFVRILFNFHAYIICTRTSFMLDDCLSRSNGLELSGGLKNKPLARVSRPSAAMSSYTTRLWENSIAFLRILPHRPPLARCSGDRPHPNLQTFHDRLNGSLHFLMAASAIYKVFELRFLKRPKCQ
jgi:hypothetical protein